MERVAVKSRDIAIIGYDPEALRLEVAFRSGSVYQYEGVAGDVHHAFLNAPSQGSYFRDHIREHYKGEKISL